MGPRPAQGAPSPMKAITYQTDPTVTPPGWAPTANIHRTQTRGIAYENQQHYVHYYCEERPFWVLSPGLTVTESKTSYPTINDWVTARFGAANIQPMILDVGHIYDGLWRPGLTLDKDIISGLGFSFAERREAELTLLLILERLNELLLYVDPNPSTLSTYGHKQRELLLLAATEVESHWRWFLNHYGAKPNGQGFSTNDYVKLAPALFLADFDVTIPRYPAVRALSPFVGWNPQRPTKSLPWYDAYNETKHDRVGGLSRASVEMCLLTVAANLVLFISRFGYQTLFNGRGNLSAHFNETFSIDLARADPATFYTPHIYIPPNQRTDFVTFDGQSLQEAWHKATIKL